MLSDFGLTAIQADSSKPFKPRKPVDNLAVLQKFIYRLSSDMPTESRARLESVIATYQRLYIAG